MRLVVPFVDISGTRRAILADGDFVLLTFRQYHAYCGDFRRIFRRRRLICTLREIVDPHHIIRCGFQQQVARCLVDVGRRYPINIRAGDPLACFVVNSSVPKVCNGKNGIIVAIEPFGFRNLFLHRVEEMSLVVAFVNVGLFGRAFLAYGDFILLTFFYRYSRYGYSCGVI